MTKDDRELFIDAFTTHCGGCRRLCDCGKQFYNSDGGWDWDDGELDELRAQSATDIPHTVATIEFEGREFVVDCDCWHERAAMILAFIDSHDEQIASLLKANMQRAYERASLMPVADHDPSAGYWSDIKTAPLDATWIEVLTADKKTHRAHFASDLSGEEQPPFEGWFVESEIGFRQLSGVVGWRPLPEHCRTNAVHDANSKKRKT